MWIITVGHWPKSEPNLPRAEQFDERADIVAGLPGLKGAIKGGRGQCVRAIVKLEAWLRNGKE